MSKRMLFLKKLVTTKDLLKENKKSRVAKSINRLSINQVCNVLIN